MSAGLKLMTSGAGAVYIERRNGCSLILSQEEAVELACYLSGPLFESVRTRLEELQAAYDDLRAELLSGTGPLNAKEVSNA